MDTGLNATHAIREQIVPMLGMVEAKARQARRALARSRHDAEDFVADTTLRVRRRPWSAMAVASVAGAMAGGLAGLMIGWQARSRARR